MKKLFPFLIVTLLTPVSWGASKLPKDTALLHCTGIKWDDKGAKTPATATIIIKRDLEQCPWLGNYGYVSLEVMAPYDLGSKPQCAHHMFGYGEVGPHEQKVRGSFDSYEIYVRNYTPNDGSFNIELYSVPGLFGKKYLAYAGGRHYGLTCTVEGSITWKVWGTADDTVPADSSRIK